jgi:outer membrane protein
MRLTALLFICIIYLAQYQVAAQVFTLRQCIQYAYQHNIQLKQSSLQMQQGQVNILANKYNQYPSLNLDLSNGYSLGRSIDPTSNQFINQGYYFNGFSAGSNVLLFGWFARRYQQLQAQHEFKQSAYQYEQAQNDIALNVATGYLRVLLAQEQGKIAEAQLNADATQASLVAKQVNAGSLPPLNLAQIQAQVANDSATLIAALADVTTALLDLKALLNMDMNTALNIATPNINGALLSVTQYPAAEQIFNTASALQPRLKANEEGLAGIRYQLKQIRASRYPQVSLSASIGSNFASTVKEFTSFTQTGEEAIGYLRIVDSLLPVYRPTFTAASRTMPIFTQFGNNLRQSIVMGINVPIFNGYNTRINQKRAELNYQIVMLTQEQDKLNLKQNIYKAQNDANNSLRKYEAALQSVKAQQLALDIAVKRLQAGLLGTQDYVVQQNNVTRAKILAVQNKYDCIFKLKILDFYMGKEIDFDN